MDFKTVNSACRTCLGSSENSISIFNLDETVCNKYSDMLTFCCGIIVSAGDQFPKTICISCIHALPGVFKFVEMCRSSDEILRKYDTSTNSKILPNFEGVHDLKTEIKEELNPGTICRFDVCFDSPIDNGDAELKLEERETGHIESDITRDKSNKNTKTVVRFPCIYCSQTFVTVNRLRKHVARSHSESKNFPCRVCGNLFKRKSDLAVHSRTHSGERPFACGLCPRRFAQSGTLAEHARRHSGDTPYACAVCSRRFSCRSSLWRHRRAHSGERPFACELCGATFAHASTLGRHALVHSGARPHACARCGRAAKSVHALRQHMLTHAEKAFVCECCGRSFSLKSNLVSHARKMHSQAAGRCAVCRKDTSNLPDHMLQHSGQAPYSCGICQKTFRQKNGLSFHTSLHINARKFKCSVGECDEAFPRKNMLDFHFRKIHSNETPHTCQICAKGFLRTSDLSRHLNTQRCLSNTKHSLSN